MPFFRQKVSCPYVQSHKVLPKYLRKHLLECSMEHPNVKLRQCKYNWTHILPSHEKKSHEAECPDRKGFEHDSSSSDSGCEWEDCPHMAMLTKRERLRVLERLQAAERSTDEKTNEVAKELHNVNGDTN